MIPIVASPTSMPTTSPPAVAPMVIGRADGWGTDDTLVVVLAIFAVLLAVTVIAAIVPQHGGRVKAWRLFGRAPAGFAGVTAILNGGMSIVLVQGSTTGALLQGPVGVALGALAGVSAVLIFVGWWWPKRWRWSFTWRRLSLRVDPAAHWMTHGLLVSAGVWGGISGANLAVGQIVSAWIAASITGFMLYAWISEVTDIGGEAGTA